MVDSLAVLRTLDESDPEFVELLATMYGPNVDCDSVYEHVFKMGPDPSESHVNTAGGINTVGNRTQARLGLAANAVGLTAGGSALASSVSRRYGASAGRMGRLVRTGREAVEGSNVLRHTASVLDKPALQVAALSGDLMADRVLARNTHPVQPTSKSVDPLEVPSVQAMVDGQHAATNKLRTFFKPTGNKIGDETPIGAKPSGVVQSAAYNMRKHPVMTAGGVTAGLGLRHNSKMKQQQQYDSSSYYPADQQDPYAKSVQAEGEFSKFDDEKHLAFGWASVVKKDGLPVVDRQGDYIHPDDLEEAAYQYVLNSRVGGDMHKRDGDAPFHASNLVESMVFTDEKIAKMGLPDNYPRGWWIGVKIHDPDTWNEVRKGGRTGFSIHGYGQRDDVSMDELMYE
jgi:hypothetical protein